MAAILPTFAHGALQPTRPPDLLGALDGKEDHAMSDSPTLYTLPQAATALSCSVGALRKWLREGRLPPVKLGRAVRLRVADVERVAREGLPGLQKPA